MNKECKCREEPRLPPVPVKELRTDHKDRNEEETGKWEETDKGIVFDDDEKMTFEDKDGVLVMDYQGVTLTFEKAE